VNHGLKVNKEMKYNILILFIFSLPLFSIRAQNNECIGNTIEIPLTGYKNGTIQWQFSTNETDWINLINANTDKLTHIITETGYFRAKVNYGNCDYFSDLTYIEASPVPTDALVGADKVIITGSTSITLDGNDPVNGSGLWTITSGTGGILDDPTAPKTTFSGSFDVKYELSWIISTACKSTTDTVFIAFYDPTKVAVDYDGNIYYTATIGTQVWMSENLKTTSYNNGEPIETTTPADLNIFDEYNPPYQWAYEGVESNVAIYGRLYTWHAATDSRGVCPTGWHLPSDAEWTVLTDFLGGESVAGGKLKETGTAHWQDPNTGATNETGFNGRPGGFRHYNGTFDFSGLNEYWWSSSIDNSGYPWARILSYDSFDVTRNDYLDAAMGASVRCLRDNDVK
jgi:uncharacterized protein (TIGR02145 family)